MGRCDKLVEVVDAEGQNVAWADRIAQQTFQFGTPYGYIYNADQNSPLYGSILAFGQSNDPPSNWQTSTSHGASFIGLGGTVPTGTDPYSQTIAKTDLSSGGHYPLWIMPKVEEPSSGELACFISSGGSPLGCSNPYCYNNKPNPPIADLVGLQCSPDNTDISFQLNVSQATYGGSINSTKDPTPDSFVEGSERLQHLFAKSYSSWVWNVGECLPVDQADFCVGSNEVTGLSCIATDGNVDCNKSNGACTPGVCLDTATGYVDKTCSATCMGGSCVPIYQCDISGASCDPTASTPCAAGAGSCALIGNECDASSVSPGVSCDPVADCFLLNNECPGGSCPFFGNQCVGGTRAGQPCDYTPVCSSNVCRVGATGTPRSFCTDSTQCRSICSISGSSCVITDTNACNSGAGGVCQAETCQPLYSTTPQSFCFEGGFQGYCSITKRECNPTASPCDLATEGSCLPYYCSISGISCDPTASTPCAAGAGACTGTYKFLMQCSSGTECRGTTSVDSCQRYTRRCALFNDTSATPPVLRGIEKVGTYCLGTGPDDRNLDGIGDTECNGSGSDNGVCVSQWCGDGPFSQKECTTNNNCVLDPALAYTYVSVGDIRTNTVDPRFAQTLWDASFGQTPALQCAGNIRLTAPQPPTQDILLEDGELCGVAPRIRDFKIGIGEGRQESGDLLVDEGNSVTISFTTQIDAQQRPIRQMAIDWGTGPAPQIVHRSSADGIGIAPKTTVADPFIFTSPPYTAGTYRITVMVQDNWLWCNGSTSGAGNYNTACDCVRDAATNACSNWLPFGLPFPGQVIVSP